MIVYPVYVFNDQWLMAILFGCDGNIKFKKKKKNFLNDNSKTTEAVRLQFGTNVAWLRTTKNCLNDDPFISSVDSIEKMLHNKCISAVAISLR